MRKIMNTDEIKHSLAEFLDESRFSAEELDRIVYSHDTAPLPKELDILFKQKPDVIVCPENVIETAKVIEFCNEFEIPITPSGSRSWGLGGSVPVMGGILLDLRRMNRIIEIDEKNLTATVECGVIWQDLYDELLSRGLFLGAYPTSLPSATVGGWINVGGVGVGSYKYGSILEQVRSLQVVLPNGRVIETGFKKVTNVSSGYNLNSLFVGSEGTLGVITKATLKIYPKPEELLPLTYTFSSIEQMCNGIKNLNKTRLTPFYINFYDSNHIKHLALLGKHTFTAHNVLNIVYEGDKDENEIAEKKTDEIMKTNEGIKQSKEIAMKEWEDRSYEFRIRRLGPGLTPYEVFIPIENLQNMFNGTYDNFEKLKLNAGIIGNVCDRNTVGFMPYFIVDERDMLRALSSLSIFKKLSDLAFVNNGRPSGIGMFLSSNLDKMHGEGAFAIRNVKKAFDPKNIMNPGKFTETATLYGIPIPGFAVDVGLDVLAFVKMILPRKKLIAEHKKEEVER